MKLTDDEIKVLDKAIRNMLADAASALRRKRIDSGAQRNADSLRADAELLANLKDRLIKEG